MQKLKFLKQAFALSIFIGSINGLFANCNSFTNSSNIASDSISTESETISTESDTISAESDTSAGPSRIDDGSLLSGKVYKGARVSKPNQECTVSYHYDTEFPKYNNLWLYFYVEPNEVSSASSSVFSLFMSAKELNNILTAPLGSTIEFPAKKEIIKVTVEQDINGNKKLNFDPKDIEAAKSINDSYFHAEIILDRDNNPIKASKVHYLKRMFWFGYSKVFDDTCIIK